MFVYIFNQDNGMKIRLRTFSFRFVEQVLNSKLSIKQEVEAILTDDRIDLKQLSRPKFNQVLNDLFFEKGWERQPTIFDEPGDFSAKNGRPDGSDKHKIRRY